MKQVEHIEQIFQSLGLFNYKITDYWVNEVYTFFNIKDKEDRLLFNYCIPSKYDLFTSIRDSIPCFSVVCSRMTELYNMKETYPSLKVFASEEEETEPFAHVFLIPQSSEATLVVPLYDICLSALRTKNPRISELTFNRIRDLVIGNLEPFKYSITDTSAPSNSSNGVSLALNDISEVKYNNVDYIVVGKSVLEQDTFNRIEEGTELYTIIMSKLRCLT